MLGDQFGVNDDLLAVILLHDACAKVDHYVYQEDGVRQAIEGDPTCAQVVIEEGNGHWEDDQVGHQEKKHA